MTTPLPLDHEAERLLSDLVEAERSVAGDWHAFTALLAGDGSTVIWRIGLASPVWATTGTLERLAEAGFVVWLVHGRVLRTFDLGIGAEAYVDHLPGAGRLNHHVPRPLETHDLSGSCVSRVTVVASDTR